MGTVAYSRMYLEAHFLSDVLGGFSAGLAYLSFTIWAVRSAPPLAEIVSWWPLGRVAEPLMVPVTASPAVDQVAAAAAVSMPNSRRYASSCSSPMRFAQPGKRSIGAPSQASASRNSSRLG